MPSKPIGRQLSEDPLAPAWKGCLFRAHYLSRYQHGITAEDLLQEARVAVWESGVTEPGLVYTVAGWRMIDVTRKWSGRVGVTTQGYNGDKAMANLQRVSLDQQLDVKGREFVDSFVDGAPTAEEEVIGQLAEAYIEEALNAWLDQQKLRDSEIVTARLRGEPLQDIADRYGLTPSRISQIRTQLLASVANRLAQVEAL